jgi:hypothetical protein
MFRSLYLLLSRPRSRACNQQLTYLPPVYNLQQISSEIFPKGCNYQYRNLGDAGPAPGAEHSLFCRNLQGIHYLHNNSISIIAWKTVNRKFNAWYRVPKATLDL